MNAVNILDEDLHLWNRFRNGDADAFASLMKLHYNDLFNYATRFTQDGEMVKDCIQDLFLSLWKNRMTISETSFVKYYLLKSLRRRLYRTLHKKKARSVYKEFEFEALFNDGPSVEHSIILREMDVELSQKMRKLLSNLSRRQQEVIYLRFYMDADIDEIAEIIYLNKQSVYNLLHDSLKKLKKITAEKPFSLSHFTRSFTLLAGI